MEGYWNTETEKIHLKKTKESGPFFQELDVVGKSKNVA